MPLIKQRSPIMAEILGQVLLHQSKFTLNKTLYGLDALTFPPPSLPRPALSEK